ncbi:MAG: hypothetical protein RL272_1191 [Candidatus Parcubacteria bacterium]|jgi:hypothetical protein
MEHSVISLNHDMVARLLKKDVPLAPERLWCVLSAELKFDGHRLAFDGTPAELRDLRERADLSADTGGIFVIWMPRLKRQRGRIPKSLRCGFTVFSDGRDLIIFQSVAFVPRAGAFDLIATTSSGQFVAVPAYHVAAWDGSSVDDPTVPAIS